MSFQFTLHQNTMAPLICIVYLIGWNESISHVNMKGLGFSAVLWLHDLPTCRRTPAEITFNLILWSVSLKIKRMNVMYTVVFVLSRQLNINLCHCDVLSHTLSVMRLYTLYTTHSCWFGSFHSKPTVTATRLHAQTHTHTHAHTHQHTPAPLSICQFKLGNATSSKLLLLLQPC